MGLLIAGIGFWAYKTAENAKNKYVNGFLTVILFVAVVWIVVILGLYGLSGPISVPANGGGY